MDRKALEARTQEVIKIRLENRLIPQARALLNRMYADVAILYRAGAFIPDMSLYTSDWEALLANHYRRVGNEFIGIEQRSKHLLNVKQVESEATASGIIAAYLLWSKERAPTQTSFILATTQNEINLAIESAKMDAPAMLIGRELNEEVATGAERTLKTNIAARSALIANVETQAPAEQAKMLTATGIAGHVLLPFQQVTIAPKPLTKEWNTVGDERVRRAHADADLQLRNQPQNFTGGGEQLKYPGDTSQGASLSNIIRCRCAATSS